MSVFLVTNTGDLDQSGNPVPGSLRAAIIAANNNNPGPDEIDFSIGAGGAQTIRPSQGLPRITDPVVLNGEKQPGFKGTPIIQLSGAGLYEEADGLKIATVGCQVRGLIIDGFGGSGIRLEGGGSNTIEDNFIYGNGVSGVLIINSSSGNTIGGINELNPNGTIRVLRGNVISNNGSINGYDGININSPGAVGNLVQGNFIGVWIRGATSSAPTSTPTTPSNLAMAETGSTSTTRPGTRWAERPPGLAT